MHYFKATSFEMWTMQRPIRIRRVVYPLLVPRRLCIILHEWCKARFVPESLRYDINMISADPTVFYILSGIHLCIYIIPKSI